MSDRKLIVLQGIPGSGKSFIARELLKKDKENKTIIVNRDSIRSMCGKYWMPERERLITSIEEDMIRQSLHQNYTVIVDATNLNPKTIKKLEKIAKYKKVEIEYVSVKVTPIQAFIQILWRSLFGGRFISYKIVKDFYTRYEDIIGVDNEEH